MISVKIIIDVNYLFQNKSTGFKSNKHKKIKHLIGSVLKVSAEKGWYEYKDRSYWSR